MENGLEIGEKSFFEELELSSCEKMVLGCIYEYQAKNEVVPDLASIVELVNLRFEKEWKMQTVCTFLTRMEKKGYVSINRSQDKPYSAAVSKEFCAKNERTELLDKVYGGATGDLIAAFLKESTISLEEKNRLKKMLDDMEV